MPTYLYSYHVWLHLYSLLTFLFSPFVFRISSSQSLVYLHACTPIFFFNNKYTLSSYTLLQSQHLLQFTTAASHPIAKTEPSEILVDSQELDTFIHHQMSSVKGRQPVTSLTIASDVAGNNSVFWFNILRYMLFLILGLDTSP